MPIQFNGPTKHGKLDLIASVPLAFDDKGAEEYFIKAGWAEKTTKTPIHTYPKGSVVIDPNTVFNGGEKNGKKVLG